MSEAMMIRLHRAAEEAAQAGHGQKEAVYQAAATELGLTVATVKARVGRINGRTRKRRADAGTGSLSRAEAEQIAAYWRETTRGTGKRLLSVEEAVAQLRAEGRILAGRVDEATGEFRPLHPSTIARALRGYQLHPDQLDRPKPVSRLASEHPNHCWQLDPSLCVLYYLRPSAAAATGLRVMPEAEFYKNKPGNLARVENERVWRYVITDHASGCVYVEYVLGAESAVNLVHCFLNAIQQRGDQPFYGVPFLLMVDPGSANTSASARNLFNALQVELIVNKPGNPRAKGQVENANNLVERQFESGLRFVSVAGLADLNAKAAQWCAWFNAVRRHSRHGMTRFAAWQRIRPDELRLAPPIGLCKEAARTRSETRKITPDLKVSFSGAWYHVDNVPGVAVGERLELCRNLYREDGVQAVIHGEDGHPAYCLLAPVETSDFGFDTRAAVIGKEHKSRVKTGLERNAETLDKLATQAETLDEAAAQRKAKALPFGGEINPYRQAETYQQPAWMPKKATALELPAFTLERPPVPIVAALSRIRELAGDAWSLESARWIRARYPEGVPEDQIAVLAGRLREGAPLADAVGSSLRSVK